MPNNIVIDGAIYLLPPNVDITSSHYISLHVDYEHNFIIIKFTDEILLFQLKNKKLLYPEIINNTLKARKVNRYELFDNKCIFGDTDVIVDLNNMTIIKEKQRSSCIIF